MSTYLSETRGRRIFSRPESLEALVVRAIHGGRTCVATRLHSLPSLPPPVMARDVWGSLLQGARARHAFVSKSIVVLGTYTPILHARRTWERQVDIGPPVGWHRRGTNDGAERVIRPP